MHTAQLAGAVALSAVCSSVLVTATPIGWAPVVRLPAVLVPALIIGLALARPWRWDAATWKAANFWEHYGATPVQVAIGLLTRPAQLATDIRTSGFLRWVVPPFLFLPFIGWRWAIGVAPIIALYSASAEPQLHRFGIYYAGVILAGALLVGSGDRGSTLRPWRPEVDSVRSTVALLAEERPVLVQSGLYPHAGYDPRVQLLTPDTFQSPEYRDAALLIAPSFGAYPLQHAELERLTRLASAGAVGGGLIVVRETDEAQIAAR